MKHEHLVHEVVGVVDTDVTRLRMLGRELGVAGYRTLLYESTPTVLVGLPFVGPAVHAVVVVGGPDLDGVAVVGALDARCLERRPPAVLISNRHVAELDRDLFAAIERRGSPTLIATVAEVIRKDARAPSIPAVADVRVRFAAGCGDRELLQYIRRRGAELRREWVQVTVRALKHGVHVEVLSPGVAARRTDPDPFLAARNAFDAVVGHR